MYLPVENLSQACVGFSLRSFKRSKRFTKQSKLVLGQAQDCKKAFMIEFLTTAKSSLKSFFNACL